MMETLGKFSQKIQNILKLVSSIILRGFVKQIKLGTWYIFQLQQYKQGVISSNVPAIEDKPKENGQVDIGDQVNNINIKVCIIFNFTFS